MRVLVCGGRDFDDQVMVDWVLDDIHRETPIAVKIDGMAAGADTLAHNWAVANKIPEERYPANWDELGKKAGFVRNKQMLDEGKPDLVVAFAGGVGTQMMMDLAVKAGVPVKHVKRGDAWQKQEASGAKLMATTP